MPVNDRFAPEAVVLRATRSRRRNPAVIHAIIISRPFSPSRFFMASLVSCKCCHPCLLRKVSRPRDSDHSTFDKQARLARDAWSTPAA